MQKKISKIRGLAAGDLVYHALYGKDWVGILVEIRSPDIDGESREMGLVRMQPGTKHCLFFAKKVSKKNRINDTMGYIAMNWLFKL